MVYERIIEATEEFDSKYWVGVGGCGSVYKVELQLGQVVVVKNFIQYRITGLPMQRLSEMRFVLC